MVGLIGGLALFFGAWQCAQDGDDGPGVSRCIFEQRIGGKSFSYCIEYSGLTTVQNDEVAKLCTSESRGRYETGASCTALSRQGSCSFKKNDVTFTYHYYPEFDATTARSNCEANGGQWLGA